MTSAPAACGMLLVDKPPGMTSHDVVAWARRGLDLRRVGHAGTLDPLASGLLPVLAGPATRLVDYLHGWPKVYVGIVQLGLETPTGDLEGVVPGEIVAPPAPPAAVLEAARARLLGPLLQVPPVYSAKKIRGTPAHQLARAGSAPTLPAVPVTVHALRFMPLTGGRIAFAARVSSGTYLRSLARDLGRLCGTGGCLAELRRTAIGPLRVRGALRPAWPVARGSLRDALLLAAAVPLPLPTIELDPAAAGAFRGGRALTNVLAPRPPGPVRVLAAGALVGIGAADSDGGLRPRVVLPEGGC